MNLTFAALIFWFVNSPGTAMSIMAMSMPKMPAPARWEASKPEAQPQ